MTCPNPDRAQLLSLAAADAVIQSPPLAMALGAAKPARLSGLVAFTETQPQHGTSTDTLVAKRALRLTFRSNESRKAFLSVHRALATYSVGRS